MAVFNPNNPSPVTFQTISTPVPGGGKKYTWQALVEGKLVAQCPAWFDTKEQAQQEAKKFVTLVRA